MAWAEWSSFGLDDALFWRSTTEEVSAVLERARGRFERFDMLAGLIAAQIVNFAGKSSKRSNLTWQDFFSRRPSGAPRLTPEQQARFESRPLMRTVRNPVRRRLST